MHPLQRARRADAVAIAFFAATHANAEHPRLLFDKDDLPELRRIAETEQGQQVLAQLEKLLAMDEHGFRYRPPPAPAYAQGYWAAGYGLQYQLTGDDRYADYAKSLVAACMHTPSAYGNAWGEPMFLLGVALAYDLWYDAWDEPFRQQVLLFLERNARQIATLTDSTADPLRLAENEHFANAEMLSPRGSEAAHWAAQLRAAAALSAMAIEDDPVLLPAPVKPADAEPIAPADDYQPWIGVPIVRFTDNNMPKVWLVNGPFYRTPKDPDPLASIGGRASARPEPAQTLPTQDTELAWRRYHPTGANKKPDPAEPLLIKTYPRNCGIYWSASPKYAGYVPAGKAKRTHKSQGQYVYLYTVLKITEPRVVQALPNRGSLGFGTRMWLGGKELTDGQLAKLTPGLYPWLVEMRITGGYANQAPRLAAYTDDDYADDLARYEAAKPLHNKANGAMPDVDQHLATLRAQLLDYLQNDLATTGLADRAGTGALGGANASVVPYLVAELNAGNTPAAGTGFERFALVGYRMPGPRGGAYRSAASAAPQLMLQDQQPAAVALTERDGQTMRYAHQAILALLALRDTENVEPVIPSDTALAESHAGPGLTTHASSIDPAQGVLVTLDHGQGHERNHPSAGQLTLDAPGNRWVIDAGRRGAPTDRLVTNTPYIQGFSPQGPAELGEPKLQANGEGSSSVTLRDGDRSWTRGLAVSFPMDTGSRAVATVTDTFTGLSATPIRWQLYTPVDVGRVKVDQDARRFTLTAKDGSVMTVTLNQPQGATLRLAVARHHNGKRALLRAYLNEPTKPEDLDEWKRLNAGIDEMIRESRGEEAEEDKVLKELEAMFKEVRKVEKVAAQGDQPMVLTTTIELKR